MTTAIQTPSPAAVSRNTSAPSAGFAPASFASRALSLAYGSVVYALFLGTFLYIVGFLAGAVVPKHINSGTPGSIVDALLVNGGFLALFAIQHTIMARRAFKERWTKIVPRQVERSTFVLVTCAILISMVALWRPMPEVVWSVEGAGAVVLWSLFAIGFGIVLLSTFLIDHFELFGLRQVVIHAMGRPHEAPKFVERSLYKLVRHPLMLGFLIAFWSTPNMTQGHLFFAVMCTGYIAFGLWIEERSLIAEHGEAYLDYKRRVRGILPLPRKAA